MSNTYLTWDVTLTSCRTLKLPYTECNTYVLQAGEVHLLLKEGVQSATDIISRVLQSARAERKPAVQIKWQLQAHQSTLFKQSPSPQQHTLVWTSLMHGST